MSHWESMAALTSLAPGADPAAALILRLGAESGRLVHVEHIAARTGQRAPWPDWVPAEVTARFSGAGVPAPWAHQAVAADLARSGQNVIISTPAASGKSLGYLLPALTAVLEGATALYIAPTRAHAAYLLTTPDMLHHMLLPRHARWNGFFRRLQYVIVDECHGYRGVFGSHVAAVLRRLLRVAAHHGGAARPAGPVFLLASATISEPAACAL